MRSWNGAILALERAIMKEREQIAVFRVQERVPVRSFQKKISGTRYCDPQKPGTRSRNGERFSVPAHPWSQLCRNAARGVGCMLYGTTYKQESAVHD